ncbi:DUF1569 domain-containing protein [Algibacter mikhailovii]|uniref:DUF1569 domain-containing protein n=1 Tax=Algibacter mikhailovii TaxID=425498 RepID=A0A918R6H1_9FLAO|nr:DUF1569 domain-containing protein [Algibacter mikhailovii]GGZ85410.1 hypothetical protein GCM10007028_24560 [Algibacter mikhailovii]
MTKKIDSLFDQIEKSIPFYKRSNKSISKSSIGWQLDHALKVVNRVTAILIKTKPERYKKELNIARVISFALCYIPRGRAKAPRVVIPPDVITREDLISQLNEARAQIKIAEQLPEKSHFIHHVFGMLSKKQTLRFLEIHTKHHLKIVNDILNK